jgi:anaerobic magnesium-protoporphyrin IX monomethyl ester cyclase
MEGKKMQGKILLIFPDLDEPLEVFGTRLRAFAPPLGPLYLAAHLMDEFEVEFLDLSASGFDREELERRLRDTNAVGISVTSYTRRQTVQLIRAIRSLRPSIPIALGGPEFDPQRPWMPEGADLVAFGEGELNVTSIFKGLLHPDPSRRDEMLSRCPGVMFRDGTGRISHGTPYRLNSDLDSLRTPAREIAPGRSYTIFGLKNPGIGASIITSRGCPFRCRFCTRSAFRLESYRERSAESVISEIERIYQEGYKVLYIVDDNFTVNVRRVNEILDGIISRGIRMALLAQGRVTTASEGLFAKMREAGFVLISFGLESGNQDVLDFYRKGTTVEQGTRAVELADRYGIFTCGSFILGAPMETVKHLDQTVEYAYEIPLDVVFFSVLNYARGSDLWAEAVSKGLIRKDEDEVLADNTRGLGRFPAEYLKRRASTAQIRFYLRPKLWMRYIRKLRSCENQEFVRLLLRGFVRFWCDFASAQLSA